MDGKVSETKTWRKVLLMSSFGFSFLLLQCIECSADLWYPMMTSFQKEIPMGFSDQYMLPPNVLLLIDTSGSMTFETESNTSTYGDGSRPLCQSSGSNWYAKDGEKYFGRDMNKDSAEANDPDNPNHYHPNLRYIDEDVINEPEYAQNITDVTSAQFNGLSDGDKEAFFAKDPTGRALFPNDSRLYKLKLVLWRIFSNYDLISNINVGISTYYQSKGWNQSDWYEWDPDSSGSEQNISWNGGSHSYARKHVSFLNTSNISNINEIKKWFDGIEIIKGNEYINDEIRADGHTPLAASIYNTGGEDNSAYEFFEHVGRSESDVIRGWCQENWLIILTDGADTANGDPVKAVEDLYKESSEWEIEVDDKTEKVIPVKTFVIGLIDDQVLTDLASDLNEMADAGDDGDKTNKSATAYFADDVETLLAAFEDIFTKIQDKKGAGNAPLVSPGSRVGSQTTSVYVAPFLPDSDGDGQWEGYLQKYSLTENASGDLQINETADWDAGLVLANTPYSSRDIYTVDWDSGANLVRFTPSSGHSLAELTISNKERFTTGSVSVRWHWWPLKPYLDISGEYTSDDWTAFAEWILGSDGRGAERWKLGDIFHSGLVEVGPPAGENADSSYSAFKQAQQERDTILYVQANDGMLHAFNAGDGEGITGGAERWGFIPPNVLYAGRLLGFKGHYKVRGPWEFRRFDTINEYLVFDTKDNTSVPRYLLDGPIVVEDVFDPNEGDVGSWKTVLLAELGYAGAGLYALDVTNPDSPVFLWSVENAVYEDVDRSSGPEVYLGWDFTDGTTLGMSTRRHVCYWGIDGDGQVGMEIHPHEDPFPADLDYRDLMFTLSVPSVGLLKTPDGNGGYEEKWVALMGNGSYMLMDDASKGAVYAIDILTGKILKTITAADLPSGVLGQVVTPISVLKKDNAQRIEQFYFGDSTGRIFEVKAASAVGGEDFAWSYREIIRNTQGNGLSYSIELGQDTSGHTWVFYATGDLDPKIVPEDGSDYFVACDTLASPDVMLTEDSLTLTDPDVLDSLLVAPSPGWYFPLTGKTVAPPQLYGGYIFYSTFVKNNEDLCKVGGSRLYVMNAFTGKGAWKDSNGNYKKYVDLTGVQISGITIKDGKVFVGAIGHEGQGTDNLPAEMQGLNPSFSNNLLVFDVPEAVGEAPQGGGQSSGEMEPRYWREWIHR